MALAIRGGKKKKGASADTKTDSTDIVNIWKDRPDPVIRPLDEYPKFVAEQLQPQQQEASLDQLTPRLE